jgi:hypothetical protein
MRDLALSTDDGALRLFTLLHEARPVLLDLGAEAASTSRHGPIAFAVSMPDTQVHGSFPRLVLWCLQ